MWDLNFAKIFIQKKKNVFSSMTLNTKEWEWDSLFSAMESYYFFFWVFWKKKKILLLCNFDMCSFTIVLLCHLFLSICLCHQNIENLFFFCLERKIIIIIIIFSVLPRMFSLLRFSLFHSLSLFNALCYGRAGEGCGVVIGGYLDDYIKRAYHSF